MIGKSFYKKATILSSFFSLAYIFFDEKLINFGHDLLNIMSDERVITIYMRTFLMALFTSSLTFIVGIILTFFLNEVNFLANKFYRAVYYLPFVLPTYFLPTAWISWIGDMGLLKLLKFDIYSFGGCLFLFTLYYLPLVIIAISNTLDNNNSEIKEAALLMGGYKRYLRKIWLPQIFPTAISSSLLVFILVINNYSIPSILGVSTFSTELYAEFGAFYNYYNAVVKTTPIFILCFVIFLFIRKSLVSTFKNLSFSYKNNLKEDNLFLEILGSICWGIFFLLTLVIPIFGLILKIESIFNIWDAIVLAREQIIFSLWFTFLAAFIIVIIAIFLAYIYLRYNLKMILNYLIKFLILPPVFIGIILLLLLNRRGLDYLYSQGILLYLGYMIRFLPLIFILMVPVVNSIPKELEEASLMTGKSYLETKLRIFLPLVMPGLLLGWIITFFFCQGEAELSILLYPPGAETISIRILSLLHYGSSEIVNGLVLLQIILLMFVTLIFYLIYKFIFKFTEMRR
ncbi:ABC transporter permease [Orenia marismortui]|uniref:ABC-type Fe3+ transport system permease subunit n=1 Tax=Orenia marismortui TaxID=46469 RepID=A0A4R8H3J4_9FIRM|nr:ABC transporter permease subunit [Orenia marismortui]TDX51154.1 ABC-type Fe3+ transport system permease subunit [Orenia marismortui]